MGYLSLFSTVGKAGKPFFQHYQCFATLAPKITNIEEIGVYTLLNGPDNNYYNHLMVPEYEEYIDKLIEMGIPLKKGKDTKYPNIINPVNGIPIQVDCKSVYLDTSKMSKKQEALFYLTPVRYAYEYYGDKCRCTAETVKLFLELTKLLPKASIYKLFVIAEWYHFHSTSFGGGHSWCSMDVKVGVAIPTISKLEERFKLINTDEYNSIHTSYVKTTEIYKGDRTPYKQAIEKRDKKAIIKLFKL